MNVSPYILTIAASWIVAQGAKYIVIAIKNRSLSGFRTLYLSGNMPSAHSATVASMATIIGCIHGINSALFGLSLMVAAVVMYDAMMVRRSVGEQGMAIRALIEKAPRDKRIVIPRAAKGHTPVEVLVGATLGVVIGIVVFITTN